MHPYLQAQIFSQPKYHQYIRENPKWYRILSRNPEKMEQFKYEYYVDNLTKRTEQIRPLLQLLSSLNQKKQ